MVAKISVAQTSGAKTQSAAKADSQSDLSEVTQEKGSTTQKTASKTKQTSASSKTGKKTANKKTSSQKSQATKTSRKTAQKTTQKTADSSKQTIQKSLAVEATAIEEAAIEEAQPLTSQASNGELLKQADEANLNPTNLAQPINFVATDHMSGDIWQPNSAIPTLDEATYASQKAQAEAQRRALEVASLNLENINSLHQLERQSIDIAISTQMNETRSAQLTGAEIDYQTQQAVNGEKSQHLKQANAKHEAAIRETGYADQLISLKDQNFELEIQQAQNVFAEKAARYRAQLTGE